MKTILGALLLLALISNSRGQGTIFVENLENTGVFNGSGGVPLTNNNPGTVYSSSVTANGLIFTMDPAAQAENLPNGPAGSQLMGVDFSFQLFGGPTPSQATSLLLSVTGSSITGDNFNWGQLAANHPSVSVPGTTAGSTVYLQLFVWEGSEYSSYFEYIGHGGGYAAASGVFANPSGGGAPIPPASLSGMPDMILGVPEPSILALCGLAATLLVWRRR